MKTLIIGALEDPISKQLEGLISKADADQLDKDNNAITRCNLFGYMPNAQCDRARKKLLKYCQQALRREAGLRVSARLSKTAFSNSSRS